MWRRLIYHPEINYALRQTLVLCLPVAAGWAIGYLQYGLLFSLVPACCNIAGLDTPHKRFFKRLIVGGSLFALSSLAVEWLLLMAVPLPVVFIGITLLLGITAEISTLHGRLLPAALLAAIFSLSLETSHMPPQTPLVLYTLGTIWFGVFNWLWFGLWREQPLRESLSLLHRQLADYCEAKYSMLTQHTNPDHALVSLLSRQQKAVDLITICYQQLHMLSTGKQHGYKRLLRIFQMVLDVQEHISVSLHQPAEVQKLVEKSHAEAVLRWNAQTVAARLRVLADDILYHRYPQRFSMDKQIAALQKIARQHPDNPVGQFCEYHFNRIAKVLRTQRPLYARDLMADRQRRLPFLPALKCYLSLQSTALRNAARIAVMLGCGSLIGSLLHLPKPYWILMTIMLVTQNSYSATRVRILHRAVGTVTGLIISGISLHFHFPQSVTLLAMLLITLISYLIIRTNYGWATIGFTITTVYTLQLLALSGEQYIIPRMIDTLIGCMIAFAGLVWLWPQWQSGLLRQNAHDALEVDQQAIRLILSGDSKNQPLSWQRMRVNQAHNQLFNSLSQAMQEPGFNSRYLAEMRLWVTHSQFIVEHINAMTTLARERAMPDSDTASQYLQSCEIAFQRCQQRVEYDQPGATEDSNIMESADLLAQRPKTRMEQHLRRILGHLKTMHTISALAWRQRPHHGIWLKRRLRHK